MWYSTAMSDNPNKESKFVSCVIIFRKFDDGIKVLLEKKSSDKYAILGGKVEYGETPKQAAVREIKEETDFDIKKKKLVTIAKFHKSPTDNKICNFYAYLDKSDKEPIPGSDVTEVGWFGIKNLPDMLWEGKAHILSAFGKMFTEKEIFNEDHDIEKVIFLDFDGVLNKDPRLGIMKHPQDFDAGNLAKYIEKPKVELLNEIIEATKADVIISSSWRNVLTIEDIKTILFDKGFKGNIVSTTELGGVEHDERWKHIKKCIKKHKPKKYIILDDDHISTDYNFHNPYFIKTDDSSGLTKDDVKRAISILNEE